MAKKLIDNEHTITLLHFDDPTDPARDEYIGGSSSWEIGGAGWYNEQYMGSICVKFNWIRYL